MCRQCIVFVAEGRSNVEMSSSSGDLMWNIDLQICAPAMTGIGSVLTSHGLEPIATGSIVVSVVRWWDG